MIRHILFWNFTEKVHKENAEEEALQFLQKSVKTMDGKIDGLRKIEINRNFSSGYDLVFYAELDDRQALQKFQNHPLHIAHRNRCKEIVKDRLVGDIETK